ncbi:uncharacterized protein LAJ45_02836 [Morchella importuna]|uniref:uncharacterized protein n=1 Tax=Morchella importuna TaxID=1174673 RepID=UPI001E8CBE2E|nr:uncharacterized protein LAJ45_02836 [Morchella importuna]KAH8153249.1 hypothetical protein LAJ45_02836 [Morchella importuna]
MLNRPISLIPVTLREAALDSPTFRGTVVHYAEQVTLVEAWLEEYIKATTRLSAGVSALEGLINTYITAGNPVGLSESMMDHDYTLLALTRYAEGSKSFWGAVMAGAQKTEASVVEPLLAFQKRDLKSFKEIRRTLETTQSRYDLLLSRYSTQSKTKEPSSLREDAFQVYEARKLYIRSCLDFCVAAPTFRAALDRVLVKIFSDQSREQQRIRRDGTSTMERHAAEIDRVRAWSEGMEASEQMFRKELVSARKELEDRAKRDWQPARDLEEYAVSTVPYLTSRPNVPEEKEGEKTPSVKQGWLFMRVLAGKPGARTSWIRRWFFVKDGVFGWLVQGFKDGAMEESEKIGVLLCNIKPAFQEERRFCFEVKTKDTTVLLQAETQVELMQWLAVFEQAKRTAVENATSTSNTQAFSIIPPSAAIPAAEPAYITKGHDGTMASAAVSTNKDSHTLGALHLPRHLHVRRNDDDDMRLVGANTMPVDTTTRATSIDISSSDATPIPSNTREKIAQKLDIGRKPPTNDRSLSPSPSPATPLQTVSGAGFSALISASHNALPFHPSGDTTRFGDTTTTLAPTTLANTPAPVMLSKAAAVTSGPAMNPTHPADLFKGHRKTQSLDTDIGLSHAHGASSAAPAEGTYPPSYPTELVAQDAHFRTLFPMRGGDEIVLLVFRATWAASATQELPGRCYVTAKRVYFYSHYLGLVFTSVVSLTHITGVTAAAGRDCDHLFLHLHPDPDDTGSVLEDTGEDERVLVKVYLEPVRLLQRRLLLLVKARHEAVEGGGEGMGNGAALTALVALEREEEAGEEHHRGADTESWEDLGEEKGEVMVTQRGIDGRVKEVTRVRLPAMPIDYRPRGMARVAFEREFEVSPKALFHVMFGDRSWVWQRLYFERRAQHILQSPWRTSETGQTRREFGYEIDYNGLIGGRKKSKVNDYQTIELQDDHLVYVVADRKTPWHLPHRERFMLVTKIVIAHVAKSKCKLSIWTGVEWSNAPAISKGIIQRQALDDLDLDALDLGDIVADQVRKLGTNEGRTKTAVRLFGDVGGEQPTDEANSNNNNPFIRPGGGSGPLASELDPRAPKLPIQQRRLTRMMAETALSFLESAASSVIMWTAAGVGKAWEVVSAQRVILLVLLVSVVWNAVVGRGAVVSYWNEKRAARWLEEVGVAPNGIMSRAVYLRDLEEVVSNGTMSWVVEGESQCHAAFRSLSESTDMDAPAATATLDFSSPSARATARRLRQGRQHLGSYRHDLLVAMRVVNTLERELLWGEWSNWVKEEMGRCAQAREMLGGEVEGEEVAWLVEYCGSCEKEGRVALI